MQVLVLFLEQKRYLEVLRNKKPIQKTTHTHVLRLRTKIEPDSESNAEPPRLQSLNWRSLAAESSSTEDKNESSETTDRFVKAALRVRSALCISSQLNKWLTEGYLETLAGGHAAAPL